MLTLPILRHCHGERRIRNYGKIEVWQHFWDGGLCVYCTSQRADEAVSFCAARVLT